MKKKAIADDEYDGPWKDALTEYFRDFLELLFPLAAASIDWNVPPRPLDKEFQKITARSKQGRQLVDKLWEVRTIDGGTEWALVHVEAQGQREVGFPERIFRYGARILDEYGHQVVSLVVLGDAGPTWRPNSFGYERWGYKLSLEFPIVKLIDLDQNSLETSSNRFAPVVLAHLKTQETKSEPASRLAWKWRIIRSLYERNLSAEDVRGLFRIIDWFMQLPEELERDFERRLEKFEEDRNMPYVTGIERRAEARGILKGRAEGEIKGRAEGEIKGRAEGEIKGRAEGEIKGRAEMLRLTLEARFGDIPAEISSAIAAISDATRFEELQRQAVLLPSLDTFCKELDSATKKTRKRITRSPRKKRSQ